MTDAVISPKERPRRFRFDWIPGVMFYPRRTFAEIAEQNFSVWLLPIMILTVTALVLVLVSGPIKREAMMMQGPEIPDGFEYWTQEQQTRFFQAAQETQKPVFIYGFPAILAVGKVWVGWLVVGGLLHFVLTLLGGRGNNGANLNIVAWSALPFAVRDIVQSIVITSRHSLIAGLGLEGFAPKGEGIAIFLQKFLASIDIYLIWHILLLGLGVRVATGLARGKSWTGVVITILVVIAVQALLGYVSTLFSGLEVTRPFFF